MSVYTLDLDSSERDPVLYPNPGDYVIELKNPIYDVKKISMISARIHSSQLLINERNNTFYISGTSVTLANNNYNGNTLAAELVDKSSNITSAVYDSNINSITFTGGDPFTFDFYDGINGYISGVDGYTTPHDILGLPASNVVSDGTTLTTGSINLQGPDAIIFKLSSGSEEFNKTVFAETPFYTGRILTSGDVINYSGVDDAVVHTFDSGPQKSISSLRIQFFYSSNNRLIPYDFRHANNIIKLAVECSTDKLENIPRVKKDFSLPPPMRIPDMEDPNRWSAFIYIFLIVLTGVILVLFTKPRKV
jgi:hypothetical protein|tara:strand:+ start:12993 stop:13910 length:918 start_codon:yes stop_codon:yes gene_type:complete